MEFDAWLREHNYQTSTIKQTLSDLRRVHSLGAVRDANVVNALRRYSAFAAANNIEDELTEAARTLGVAPVKRLPDTKDKTRKLEARSFEEDDWTQLRASVIESTDPRDQVLACMIVTGLRVGDVLRIQRVELARMLEQAEPVVQAEVKGGQYRPVPIDASIRAPWDALARGVLATKARNVAQYVAPTFAGGDDVRGSSAYRRVDRRLKAWQRKLGLEGRANLQRIRRTIAVKSLDETDNVLRVQQMLGHRSVKSTGRYIDEHNLRAVRRLQRKLAGLEED